MKKILFIFIFFFSNLIYANPAPFGLEINKVTLSEVKKKYTLIDKGISIYSKGPMMAIDKSQLSFDGLLETRLIFSESENKLVAVTSNFDKSRFDSLNNNLSQKYELTSSSIPFVGSKFVSYKYGDTIILLDAPHLSFTLNLLYATEEFMKNYQDQIDKENQNKNQKELNNL